MAHADYSCCAICDCKMSYGEDATKEEICTDCLKTLRSNGIQALDPGEFVEWAKSKSLDHVEDLREILKAIGYSACCYGNDFDRSIDAILIPSPTQTNG